MKLTYRGVSYDYTPNSTPSMGPTIATGTYRGHVTTFHTLAEMPPQPSEDLTWRGVDYCSSTAVSPVVATAPMVAAMEPVVAVEEQSPAVPKPVASDTVATLARNLFIRHHQRSRKREQGMMVRLAAEVGIPVENAAAYESHVQGKLPHDFSGYDRSASAMS
jgi:hypothetical protein